LHWDDVGTAAADSFFLKMASTSPSPQTGVSAAGGWSNDCLRGSQEAFDGGGFFFTGLHKFQKRKGGESQRQEMVNESMSVRVR